MGGAERVRRLLHDPAGFLHWELPPPPNPGGHRFAVDVAHDEVDQALALTDGMNGDDVRMRKSSRGLGLAGKSLSDVLLECELGRQDLDRHSPLQSLVPGPVY